MSNIIQYDIFEDSVCYQDQEINLINMKVDNVRKGLFKRHGELSKMYISIWDRQEKLDTRLFAVEQFLKEKGFKTFDGMLNL